jgi:capsid assembly protease
MTAEPPQSDICEGDQETIALVARIEIEARNWAVLPDLLAALTRTHGRFVTGETLARLEAARPSRSAARDGVATIPLKGVLMPDGGLLSMLFGGGGGLAGFKTALNAAAGDPDVASVVLDVDSPGGLVDQIPELAADLRAARAQKPIVAVANTMAASAAYWLASQADEVVVTPSGEVGSIGVYQLHRDLSAMHEQLGVAPSLISAGKYKVEGNPYQPLGEEARAAMQADVNDYYDLFTADVARGRGVSQSDVQNGFGEGRSLLAKRAVQAGLADRVDTLAGTVRRLSSPSGKAALERKRAGLEDSTDLTSPSGDADAPRLAYSSEERSRLLAVLAD